MVLYFLSLSLIYWSWLVSDNNILILQSCSLRNQPSGHFPMAPLVSLQNDDQGMSKEISYWWCITTQIWVVLELIGWNLSLTYQFISTTFQIRVVTLHRYVIFLLFRQTSFHRETSSGVTKNECWLFSQASNHVNNDLAGDNWDMVFSHAQFAYLIQNRDQFNISFASVIYKCSYCFQTLKQWLHL